MEVAIMSILPWVVASVAGVGGYAVLKKRVGDLEENEEGTLSEDKHDDLCKIAKFEMKDHVTETMTNFDSSVFKPAMTELLKEIKNNKV